MRIYGENRYRAIKRYLQYLFGTEDSELDGLILNAFGAWSGAALINFVRWFLNMRGEKRNRKERHCEKTRD